MNADVIGLAICPLCEETFIDTDAFKAHLETEHGLVDDDGTETVVSPVPDGSASASDAEAASAAKAQPAAAAEPRRDGSAPAGPSGRRLPMASTHGDIALYVPGALMVGAAVIRSRPDAFGIVLAVLGTIVVLVGMLLPLLERVVGARHA